MSGPNGEFRRQHVPDRQGDQPAAAGPRSRGTRFRIDLVPRAQPHPHESAHAVGRQLQGAAATRGVLAHLRPGSWRSAWLPRSPSRSRSAPASRSSPNATRSGWPKRSPRSTAVGWSLAVRHRLRLEQGRTGPPRGQVLRPAGGAARAHPRHEADLDQRRGGVPRRTRRVLVQLVVAQAGAKPPSADHSRWRGRAQDHGRPRRVLRWVHADRRSLRHRRPGHPDPSDGDRRRARPCDDRVRPVRHAPPRPRSSMR